MADQRKCKAIRRMEKKFNQTEKSILYAILGGVYNCPLCKKQHQLSWEVEEIYEVAQA